MSGPNVHVSKVQKPDSRLQRLAILVELERRFRRAETTQSLQYLLVNETHAMTPYRQAALWRPSDLGRNSLLAVSGLANPDNNAPYSSWLNALCTYLNKAEEGAARALSSHDVPSELSNDWDQWLPENALWLPLRSETNGFQGALLLSRDEPWNPAELKLLEYLAEAWLHCHSSIGRTSRSLLSLPKKSSKLWLAVGLVVIAALLFPVHQTALVPAEIIAREPLMIRAPVDGVVDQILVSPNQQVSEGDIILRLDATRLENRLEVALKALEVADAEYRQMAQQGLFDSRANAELAMLKGRSEQHEAEVSYLQDMLERITIRAPRNGIVIFDDVNDWLGRPVSIGERIMSVANPALTEVELRVPVADAIALEDGARVRLFLNTAPYDPLDASLHYASYQASLTPEGIMSYRLLAQLSNEQVSPRIGLKGTAKVYGDRTLLIVTILRRPLTSLRQMLGV